mgnify:CR=1 FL=1
MPNITEQFKQAMRDAGLEPPDRIEPDKFMRFPSIGKAKTLDGVVYFPMAMADRMATGHKT